MILIGDHKQLPPFVIIKDEVEKAVKYDLENEKLDMDKVYGTSFFEYMIEKVNNSNTPLFYKIMLNIQYRMPRQLGYLISKHIYDGELKNPELSKIPDYDKDKNHHLTLKIPTVEIDGEQMPNSIIFISTSNKKDRHHDGAHSITNECNVKTIQKIMESLNGKYKESDEMDIGIIAGYRGQVNLLKNKIQLNKYTNLSNSRIDTVDKFQGSEKDIIIFDIVRSTSGNSNIGFLADYRRINVAFSRAKKLLIIVGDSEYILKLRKNNPNPNSSNSETKQPVIKSIIEQLNEWGCIYNSIEEAIQNDHETI